MRGVAMCILAGWFTAPTLVAVIALAPVAVLGGGSREAALGGVVVIGVLVFVGNLLAVWAASALFGREAPRAYEGYRDCPHCLSAISEAARVCRYCGRDVHPARPTGVPTTAAALARESRAQREAERVEPRFE